MSHVAILGLMGIGKTTTAETLAARLGWGVRDSDADIERTFDRTGRDLAQAFGVPTLHRIEAAMLIGALAAETPSVIAAAASVVEDEAARLALANRAFTVVLDADLDTVEARAATGGHRRPLPREELEVLAARRGPWFDEVADLVLDAADTPGMLVDRIVADPRLATSLPSHGERS